MEDNIQNIVVTEHRVYRFFPFVYSDNKSLGRSAVRSMQQFVQDLLAMETSGVVDELGFLLSDAASVSQTEAFWGQVKMDEAIVDLHPAYQQIVGRGNNANGLNLCQTLQVDNKNLLEKTRNPNKDRWFLLPIKGKNYSAKIFRPSIHIFLSGVAILLIPMEYGLDEAGAGKDNKKMLDVNEIMDANYELTHIKKTKENSDPLPGARCVMTTNTLVGIAATLIPGEYRDRLRGGRGFVYSAIQTSCQPEPYKAIEIVHRLAFRQNESYHSTEDRVGLNKLRVFDYLTHAAAHEGGAVLIEERNNQFLKTFIKNKVNNTYLPLLISSFHSQFWLLQQVENLSQVPVTSSSREERVKIECLSERLLDYRRYFQYPIPSNLSTHNDYHNLWQEALEINRLYDFLLTTAQESAESLRLRQLRAVTYVSSGVAGLITTQQLLGVIRDRELDNNYLWMRRLMIDLDDAKENEKTFAEVRADINKTVATAQAWEDYMFFGSLVGLSLGFAFAYLLRLRNG